MFTEDGYKPEILDVKDRGYLKIIFYNSNWAQVMKFSVWVETTEFKRWSQPPFFQAFYSLKLITPISQGSFNSFKSWISSSDFWIASMWVRYWSQLDMKLFLLSWKLGPPPLAHNIPKVLILYLLLNDFD